MPPALGRSDRKVGTMNKHNEAASKQAVPQQQLSTLAGARAPIKTLSSLTSELCRIHAAAGSAMFKDWLADLVVLFSPGGRDELLNARPRFYQSQSARTVKALAESAQSMLQAQQGLFDWQLESLGRMFTRR